MSGLPASGKTMLGRQIGAILGLPVLDKDDYLETLFGENDIGELDLRSTLSREADVLLEHAARATEDGAVIVSFWRRPELSPTSGTPTDWLLSLGRLTEEYCDCPPLLAMQRFTSQSRHPGHLDGKRSESGLLAQFRALDELGPVGLGTTVLVDTSIVVDAERVADAVRRR